MLVSGFWCSVIYASNDGNVREWAWEDFIFLKNKIIGPWIIQEMFTRFTNIINELTSLGKEITSEEQVQKILRSLPKDRWMAKVTALQETKDFTKFNLEQLAGSLMTHELHLGTKNGDMSKQKSFALKADESDDSKTGEKESTRTVRKIKRIFRNMKNGDDKGKIRNTNQTDRRRNLHPSTS